MRMYLLLKQRGRGVPRRPRGARGDRRRPRSPSCASPPWQPGETYADLLADRTAYEQFDAGAYFGGKGFGFVGSNQLAIEHLMGAR